jgi:hypothetical protein
VRVTEQADREFLISEMVRPGAMTEMSDDNYANYVVQTALDYSEGEQREELLNELLPLLPAIKHRSWYKRVMMKIGLPNHPVSQLEPPRQLVPRTYIDDRVHPRMTSDPGYSGSSHGYVQASERSTIGNFSPGYMHPNPVGGQLSDRNGYRGQSVQSHAPQQFGNFYPYGPRIPHDPRAPQDSRGPHDHEYRPNGNGEY